MIVGERVAERLAHSGMSQGELARRVGVSQPTINNLIKRSKKGSSHLHRVARELGTTPDYLEGLVDDPAAGVVDGERLSSDEREWLELYKHLTPAQRKAIRTFIRDVVGVVPPDALINDRDCGAPDFA